MGLVSAWRKTVAALLMSAALFSVNGCVYLVVGGVGALGGYVVSPDTVEGTIAEQDYETVWNTTVEVLSRRGIVDQQNEQTGILTAKVNKADVTVTVFRVGMNSTKLSVKARRMMFPRVKMAQKIYVDIVTAVESGADFSS